MAVGSNPDPTAALSPAHRAVRVAYPFLLAGPATVGEVDDDGTAAVRRFLEANQVPQHLERDERAEQAGHWTDGPVRRPPRAEERDARARLGEFGTARLAFRGRAAGPARAEPGVHRPDQALRHP